MLLTLVSCGFQPVYSPVRTEAGLSGGSFLNQVYIEPLSERSGQILRNMLLDRGFADDPVPNGAKLSLYLSESLANLGVAPDSTATRNQLTITASLVMTRDNQTVLSRTLVSRATYNVLLSQYTTIVSENAAREEALSDLARQIETQVAISK